MLLHKIAHIFHLFFFFFRGTAGGSISPKPPFCIHSSLAVVQLERWARLFCLKEMQTFGFKSGAPLLVTTFEGGGFDGLFLCFQGCVWDDVYPDQSLQRFNSHGNYPGGVLQGFVQI